MSPQNILNIPTNTLAAKTCCGEGGRKATGHHGGNVTEMVCIRIRREILVNIMVIIIGIRSRRRRKRRKVTR